MPKTTKKGSGWSISSTGQIDVAKVQDALNELANKLLQEDVKKAECKKDQG